MRVKNKLAILYYRFSQNLKAVDFGTLSLICKNTGIYLIIKSVIVYIHMIVKNYIIL